MKFLWIALLAAQVSLANEDVGPIGNGGDAVVCRNADKTIQRAELLDFYEAKNQRGMDPVARTTTDWKNIALEWLARLSEFAPQRAARYRIIIGQLERSTLLIGNRLVDFPDSNHLTIPRGCRVEQVALIQKARFDEDKMIVIDQEIWAAFSETDRAGLMLHAAITKDNEATPQRTSAYVRYFNSLIAADRMPQPKTDKERLLFFRDRLGFYVAETKAGLPVILKDADDGKNEYSLAFHDNGHVKTMKISERYFDYSEPVKIKGSELYLVKIGPHEFYKIKRTYDLLDSDLELNFYASGRLKTLRNFGTIYLKTEWLRPNLASLMMLSRYANDENNSLECAYLSSDGLSATGESAPMHYRGSASAWWKYKSRLLQYKGASSRYEYVPDPVRFSKNGIGRQASARPTTPIERFRCEYEGE